MSQTIFRFRRPPGTGSMGVIIKNAMENKIVMALYRFRLRDGSGGTYRTGAMTVDMATQELLKKYGKRLYAVERVVAS